jgi:hypothetical protein
MYDSSQTQAFAVRVPDSSGTLRHAFLELLLRLVDSHWPDISYVLAPPCYRPKRILSPLVDRSLIGADVIVARRLSEDCARLYTIQGTERNLPHPPFSLLKILGHYQCHQPPPPTR